MQEDKYNGEDIVYIVFVHSFYLSSFTESSCLVTGYTLGSLRKVLESLWKVLAMVSGQEDSIGSSKLSKTTLF